MSAEQQRRTDWLATHADTLSYRDQLAAQVAARRHEMGVTAAVTQPDHIVDLIGPVPTDDSHAARDWVSHAGRIEAYREEWNVDPHHLRQRPVDFAQQLRWDETIHTFELLERLAAPTAGSTPGRAVDIGIEL